MFEGYNFGDVGCYAPFPQSGGAQQQPQQAQQAQQHDIDNNQHDAVARPEDAFVEFVEEDNNANVNVITQRGGDEEDNEEDEANEEDLLELTARLA